MMLQARDRIHTLRVVGKVRDSLAVRMQLERELALANLQPRSLPPAAILCVHRVRVPAARHATGWAAHIDRQMQSLLAEAARPWREAVPAAAGAVLFADEKELLACLARDWQRGVVHDWWWHELFGEPVTDTFVQRVFYDAAPLIPAVFHTLATQRCLVEFVRALPATYCARLAEQVAASFGIAEMQSMSAIERFQARTSEPHRSAPAAKLIASVERALARHTSASDLARLVDSQALLLKLAVLVHHAPRLARTPGAGEALRSAISLVAPQRSPRSTTDVAVSAPVRIVRTERTQPGQHPAEPRHTETGPEEESARALQEGPRLEVTSSNDERSVETSVLEAAPVETEGHNITPQPIPSCIDSACAGVFYLVNVAIYMELYGDFTQPRRPGLALPIGDFLALIAEAVCGIDVREDAIWELLARLSDRNVDDAPGRGFMKPRKLARAVREWTASMETRVAASLGRRKGDALRYLCMQAGAIALSDERIDVFFSLASHPFAIRVAGLDRNPGWVPAAGRIIEFHYE